MLEPKARWSGPEPGTGLLGNPWYREEPAAEVQEPYDELCRDGAGDEAVGADPYRRSALLVPSCGPPGWRIGTRRMKARRLATSSPRRGEFRLTTGHRERRLDRGGIDTRCRTSTASR